MTCTMFAYMNTGGRLHLFTYLTPKQLTLAMTSKLQSESKHIVKLGGLLITHESTHVVQHTSIRPSLVL